MRRATEHGELWWAHSDKPRPVVVVGRDDVRGARARTTVAPVTRTVRGLASEVELDRRDGLPLPCVASCDELGTIPKSKLIRRIGRLSEAKLLELADALRFSLQLD
jgi:mRNA interferase MazF